MSEGFKVKIDADKLQEALRRLPRLLTNELNKAGYKVSKEILETEGLKKYPPLTTQKRDAGVGSSWYERGRGTAYHSAAGITYNETSERYGTQWGSSIRPNKVRLYNNASYGMYLGGQYQAKHMRKFGWRKILSVIREKMWKIKSLYKWAIHRAIRKAGFKVRGMF